MTPVCTCGASCVRWHVWCSDVTGDYGVNRVRMIVSRSQSLAANPKWADYPLTSNKTNKVRRTPPTTPPCSIEYSDEMANTLIIAKKKKHMNAHVAGTALRPKRNLLGHRGINRGRVPIPTTFPIIPRLACKCLQSGLLTTSPDQVRVEVKKEKKVRPSLNVSASYASGRLLAIKFGRTTTGGSQKMDIRNFMTRGYICQLHCTGNP